MEFSKEGKDEVIFLSAEDEEQLHIVEERDQSPLSPDVGEEAVGPDGKIDWDCPCLAGMTEGPCGDKFKDAFECFVYSKEEEKGSDCMENFRAMHECLAENPDYYGQGNDDDEEGGEEDANGESKDDEADGLVEGKDDSADDKKEVSEEQQKS